MMKIINIYHRFNEYIYSDTIIDSFMSDYRGRECNQGRRKEINDK